MRWLFLLHSGSNHTHTRADFSYTIHVTRLNAPITTIHQHANSVITANATLIIREKALTMAVNATLIHWEITLMLITDRDSITVDKAQLQLVANSMLTLAALYQC